MPFFFLTYMFQALYNMELLAVLCVRSTLQQGN